MLRQYLGTREPDQKSIDSCLKSLPSQKYRMRGTGYDEVDDEMEDSDLEEDGLDDLDLEDLDSDSDGQKRIRTTKTRNCL